MFAVFVVGVDVRGVDVKATRGGERAQAGACSPLTVQTERDSSCAVVSGVGVWWSRGGGKGSPALSTAHLVLEALRY
jgi:hypothetical protein